jgi:hypothetical protein
VLLLRSCIDSSTRSVSRSFRRATTASGLNHGGVFQVEPVTLPFPPGLRFRLPSADSPRSRDFWLHSSRAPSCTGRGTESQYQTLKYSHVLRNFHSSSAYASNNERYLNGDRRRVNFLHSLQGRAVALHHGAQYQSRRQAFFNPH